MTWGGKHTNTNTQSLTLTHTISHVRTQPVTPRGARVYRHVTLAKDKKSKQGINIKNLSGENPPHNAEQLKLDDALKMEKGGKL